jgi:Domain of unknown function (DUF4336)
LSRLIGFRSCDPWRRVQLAAIDKDLWVAEVPLRFLGAQLGRRMAVIRLRSQDLLVHSPAPLSDELRRELDELGSVRFIVPASWIHGHLYMEHYAAAYPKAELFAAPGLRRRRRDLTFAGDLNDRPNPRWAAELDQAAFRGQRIPPEIVFFHRPSKTLIVGDVVWNVTPRMSTAARFWAGWRTRVTPTPAFRLSIRDQKAAATSVRRILEWDFDRIVIGHGEMVKSGGRQAFANAYAWVL